MPPIRLIREILDPLSTTPDQIEDAIIQDVMKPITSVLIKDNPHWTSYGMFFFGLLWMEKKFGPRKPQPAESQMGMANVLAEQVAR